MTVIRVDVQPRPYDVLVGPVEAGIERIVDLAKGSSPVLVSEPRVFALHGAKVAEALGARPVQPARPVNTRVHASRRLAGSATNSWK